MRPQGAGKGAYRVLQEMSTGRREKSPKRMKRTVLTRRPTTPGTPGTPVPRWKQPLSSYKLRDRAGMATPTGAPSPSARKLAALMWELHDIPLPACFYSPNWIPYSSSPLGATPDDMNDSPFSQPDYVLNYSPSSLKSSADHRHLIKSVSLLHQAGSIRGVQSSLQKLLTNTGVEPDGDSPQTPTKVGKQRHIPTYPLFATTGLDELDSDPNGPTTATSQELLKVFSQIRILEEKHNSSLKITSALHAQLMEAHARLKELELPNRVARREMEGLMKRFSDEKLTWQAREKERIKAALDPVKEDLKCERKAKERLEVANQRLTKELREAQSATAKALQEFETERSLRRATEEMCRDLACETGNGKVEVEEIKRATQQERDALEEERRMLQMAELWREERVQMKLGEARLALEAKSAALDTMRAELESFLSRKRDAGKPAFDIATFRDAQALHDVLSAIHYDTSISTFPPTSSISSGISSLSSSSSSFSHTYEYMRAATAVDTDSSQGSRKHGHGDHLFYPEGIPDAD